MVDLQNQRPRCKQRGIKLAALQSSGVFDPRGSFARGNKTITIISEIGGNAI